MRKFTVVALMLSGLSLAAGEPSILLRGEGASLSTHGGTERNILKVRNSFSGASFMKEEDREAHGPGLFVNLGLFMPGSRYMNPYPFYVGENYKTGYTLEVGNYFRLFNTDRLGIGLRATWIQLGYTAHPDTNWSEGNAWASPLRIGPQASYLITEQIGIDAFYQLGAQYNIDWWNGENQSFMGLNHEFGLGLRFLMFNAGFTIKSGAIKNIDNSDPTWELEKVLKFSTGGMRIFLGIQL